MQAEHSAHEAVLHEFLMLIAALVAEPARLEMLQHELRSITAELRVQLGAHLEAEERILFPTVARFCDANLQATMLDNPTAAGDMKSSISSWVSSREPFRLFFLIGLGITAAGLLPWPLVRLGSGSAAGPARCTR